MPKKTTKLSAKKLARTKKPAAAKKPAPAKAIAKAPVPTPQAVVPAENAQANAPKPKAAAVPPKPVPPHQQFLNKGGIKPQAMMKARIIRHQGR